MKICKQITVLFAVLIFVLFTPVNSFAIDKIDLNRNAAITIFYQSDGIPLTGARFNLYKIASVNENGVFTNEPEFADVKIDTARGIGGWQATARTFEGYIAKNKINPVDTVEIDTMGYASFFNGIENIPKGLYLITADVHHIDNIIYESESILVSLPTMNTDRTGWIYDIIVNPKFSFFSLDPNGTISRKVIKVWHGDEAEQSRPENVKIHLLKNSEIYDSVVLNADNNWRYSWSGLDPYSKWTVYEEKTKNYIADVTQEEITFVVTNTFIPPKPTPVPTPQPGNTPIPGPTPEHTPPSDEIHDFGQLWWPVPVLITGGVVLIILGVVRRRSEQYENQ